MNSKHLNLITFRLEASSNLALVGVETKVCLKLSAKGNYIWCLSTLIRVDTMKMLAWGVNFGCLVVWNLAGLELDCLLMWSLAFICLSIISISLNLVIPSWANMSLDLPKCGHLMLEPKWILKSSNLIVGELVSRWMSF